MNSEANDVEEPMYSDDSTDDSTYDEEAEVLVVLDDFDIILSEYQEYPQFSGPCDNGLALYEYPIAALRNYPGIVILELNSFMPGVPPFYAYTSDDTLRRNPELLNKLAEKYKVKYYESDFPRFFK
jgi:hypothetical protein